jgi:hypothetical protein
VWTEVPRVVHSRPFAERDLLQPLVVAVHLLQRPDLEVAQRSGPRPLRYGDRPRVVLGVDPLDAEARHTVPGVERRGVADREDDECVLQPVRPQ